MKTSLTILLYLFIGLLANSQALLENNLGESSSDFQSYVNNINDWKIVQTHENVKVINGFSVGPTFMKPELMEVET